jgi:hypothetical protein
MEGNREFSGADRFTLPVPDRERKQKGAEMKYRKKPVVVEAFQMKKELWVYHRDWPKWLNEAWDKPYNIPGSVRYLGDVGLVIRTLEGEMVAAWNDWIIRGVKGELYPCKPDIFEQTYEPVEETTQDGVISGGQFWLVWVPGKGWPKKKHFSRSEAVAESKRLAGKEGRSAYVLECVGFSEQDDPPVTFYELREA